MNITQENYKDLFNKSETRTLELTFNKVNHNKSFFTFDILPAFMFIKNGQMADYYKDINEEPIISYSLVLQWLGFYIDLTYNKKIKYENM